MCLAMRGDADRQEEEALHLYASAADKQLLQPPRSKIAQSFHQHIDLMEAFMIGQFVEKLEDRTFRC